MIVIENRIPDGTRGAVLVAYFKGHSKENVKAYTRILNSGTDASPENDRYLIL